MCAACGGSKSMARATGLLLKPCRGASSSDNSQGGGPKVMVAQLRAGVLPSPWVPKGWPDGKAESGTTRVSYKLGDLLNRAQALRGSFV